MLLLLLLYITDITEGAYSYKSNCSDAVEKHSETVVWLLKVTQLASESRNSDGEFALKQTLKDMQKQNILYHC